MPKNRFGRTSTRARKARPPPQRRKETPARNAWELLPAGLARALSKPLSSPAAGRWRGSFAASPKIRERFAKSSPGTRAPPQLGLLRVADSPSRSTLVHSRNRAEAPGEILFQLLPVSRHEDRIGQALCACHPGGDRCLRLSGIPLRRLPSGSAGTRDRRENDGPRPTRDTDALRGMQGALTDPDTRARVGTTPRTYRNSWPPSRGTRRRRFESPPAQGKPKPKPEQHRHSKDQASALVEGTGQPFPGNPV